MADQKSWGTWLKEFFAGKPEEFHKEPRFTPDQQRLIAQALQKAFPALEQFSNQGQDPLAGLRALQLQNLPFQQQPLLNQTAQNLQTNYSFDPIEQRARSMFAQRTVPSIAERFTQMGGQRSSGFARTLGQAGADLESNLAGLRSQYGLQQQGLQQNLLSNLLGAQLGQRGQEMNLASTLGKLGIAQQGQQQGNLQSLLGLGLTPLHESAYLPATGGFFGQASENAKQMLPYLAMMFG